MLFKFRIEFAINDFVSRDRAKDRAYEIVNSIANFLALFGIQMTAQELD